MKLLENRFIFINAHVKAMLAVLLFFSSMSTFSQQTTIVLNSAFNNPISNETQTGFGDKVLSEAFKRMGYKLETSRLPAERALINANKGIDDGDLLRISGLQKKYPNLIQVPEKIMDMDVMLFTKNKPSFKVKGWDSIRSHSISIITGWKVFELNLGAKVDITKTDNIQQIFTMLKKNRADFAGHERWTGLAFLKDNKITDITMLEPPLISTPLYTYLHKKHKKLVPQLSAQIKKMKQDGSIKKYTTKY